MIFLIFLFLIAYLKANNIIELKDEELLTNLILSLNPNSYLLFKIKNAEKGRCYKYYASKPAGVRPFIFIKNYNDLNRNH